MTKTSDNFFSPGEQLLFWSLRFYQLADKMGESEFSKNFFCEQVYHHHHLDAISGGGELADSEGPIQADACRPLCSLQILPLHIVLKSLPLLLFINLHQHLPPRPAPSERPSSAMDHCSCVSQSGDPTSNLAKPAPPAKNFL